APGFICKISSDIFKTLAPEHLALSGYVELPFEAVRFRIVAALFPKHRSCNTEPRIFTELRQEKLEMIRVQKYVGVQIPDYLILQMFHSFLARVECIHFGRKIPLPAHR